MPGMDGFINFNGTLEGSIAGGGGGDVTDVKVRDSQETTFESVVNEEGVAEIDLISYIRRNELTQAIENVENSIDNVEELVDTKQNIVNFSTEEQNTGLTWIDGSYIYQRSFPFNISTVSDWTLFDNSVNYNLLLSSFGIITSVNACYPFVSNFDDVPRWCVQNGILKYYYNGSAREGYVTCLYTKSA